MSIIDALDAKLRFCGYIERLSLYLEAPQDESEPFRYRVMIEEEDGRSSYEKVEGDIDRRDISNPRDWVEMGALQLSRMYGCPVIGYYSSVKVAEHGETEA